MQTAYITATLALHCLMCVGAVMTQPRTRGDGIVLATWVVMACWGIFTVAGVA